MWDLVHIDRGQRSGVTSCMPSFMSSLFCKRSSKKMEGNRDEIIITTSFLSYLISPCVHWVELLIHFYGTLQLVYKILNTRRDRTCPRPGLLTGNRIICTVTTCYWEGNENLRTMKRKEEKGDGGVVGENKVIFTLFFNRGTSKTKFSISVELKEL